MKVDKTRFDSARSFVLGSERHERISIGTYKERSRHLIIKHYYDSEVSHHEIPFLGSVADIKNGNDITEIQTSGFGSLKEKLEAFLASDIKVTVVYPAANRKRTVWIDPETGDTSDGRYISTPRNKYSVLPELLRISDWFGHPNLSVDIFLGDVTDTKLLDGYGADRRRRATKTDTVPDTLDEIITLTDADSVRDFIPFSIGDKVTSNDFSKAFGLVRKNLWMAIQFLKICEVIAPVTKNGRNIIYEILPYTGN